MPDVGIEAAEFGSLAHGHRIGLDMFRYNVSRFVTWDRLIATFGIIPVLALVGYAKWPSPLKMMFWVVVPIWLVVHLFGGVLAETRLLLVPYALVLVPGVLFLVARPAERPAAHAAPALT